METIQEKLEWFKTNGKVIHPQYDVIINLCSNAKEGDVLAASQLETACKYVELRSGKKKLEETSGTETEPETETETNSEPEPETNSELEPETIPNPKVKKPTKKKK